MINPFWEVMGHHFCVYNYISFYKCTRLAEIFLIFKSNELDWTILIKKQKD